MQRRILAGEVMLRQPNEFPLVAADMNGHDR